MPPLVFWYNFGCCSKPTCRICVRSLTQACSLDVQSALTDAPLSTLPLWETEGTGQCEQWTRKYKFSEACGVTFPEFPCSSCRNIIPQGRDHSPPAALSLCGFQGAAVIDYTSVFPKVGLEAQWHQSHLGACVKNAYFGRLLG